MPCYRLCRLRMISTPVARNIFTPRSRIAIRTVGHVYAGRIGGRLILLVRRSQPAPLQQRHGIRPIVTESSRYPVRIVTGGTETVNHGGIGYYLIGIPAGNSGGELVNYCDHRSTVDRYLAQLPAVCSPGNQKIKILPFVRGPAL